jgi:hypothetical protein
VTWSGDYTVGTRLRVLPPNSFRFGANGHQILLFEPSNQSAKPNATANKNKWQYITDLILFIVAGILVLLLCEMLFRFASLFSIATVDSLRPLLEELADLKIKIAELGKEVKSPSSSSVLAA